MESKSQILCTFIKKNKVLQAYSKILEHYQINRQITLFQVKGTYEQILIFDTTGQINSNVEDTISLHKKSQTDTYYTINALNEIIKQNNNGELDLKFKIDWENYRNCLLLYNNRDGLKILKLIYVDHIVFE